MASPGTNGSVHGATDVAPGVPGKPYIISSQQGETIYIPLSKSATRLLVTGKETENAFAVVASGGSQSDPIGFHFHKHAHDVFLCLKGHINVWANDEARTLEAGDFASVPPYAVHQYQITGNHSEFLGLIVPGGWEEFFRFIGEPYHGPLWPLEDNRNIFEVLIPKLKAAAEQFDMVPVRDKDDFGPQPWTGSENSLPGKLEPYFLKSGTGPAYLAGGALVRPLITTAESDGRFVIGTIEGSSHHSDQDVFASGRKLKFAETHHAFHVTQGLVEFHIDSSPPSLLHADELVYIPRATPFSYQIRSRYAKLHVFANGRGLVELLIKLGEKHALPTLPEKAKEFKTDHLNTLTSELDHEVV